MKKVYLFIYEAFLESVRASTALYKIMIPALIIIKALQEIGAITLLSEYVKPLMAWVGLPSELGLVWASTMVVNIYAGLIVLFNIGASFTVVQMTILGGMMLIAHALPIEIAIAKKAGVSICISLAERIGGSLLFGWLLCHIYSLTDLNNRPAKIVLELDSIDPSWKAWVTLQLEALALIFVVIFVLMMVMNTLKSIGVEKVIALILSPMLRFLGISQKAVHISIIGMTLGLTYGGGLLIREAKTGSLDKNDIVYSILLLNILHSLIEDTLLVLMMGADFMGIFFGRIIFALIFISILIWVLKVVKKKG